MLLLLSGCVTSSDYKMAKEPSPPMPLGWTTTAESTDLTLEALIVCQGPGSWKQDARWDEYAVRIKHRGSAPLVIVEAVLIGFNDQPQFPGSDPWDLEKLSRTNWDRFLKLGANVGIGYLGLGVYGTAGFMGIISGGMVALLPAVMVADVAVVKLVDMNRKGKIQEEFNRRRLPLPLTIAPGETRIGSLFFSMTPGPKRLLLHGGSAGQNVELVLEMPRLSDLYLPHRTP